VYYGDGAFLTNEAAELATEPDGMMALWNTLKCGHLRLLPRADGNPDGIELSGTPDLVIEVVSRSSVRKDSVTLRTAYARANIPEYWLIDARGEELAFQIWRIDTADHYVAAAGAGAPQPSGVLGAAASFWNASATR
jgi:Uma2 family endonuclease